MQVFCYHLVISPRASFIFLVSQDLRNIIAVENVCGPYFLRLSDGPSELLGFEEMWIFMLNR